MSISPITAIKRSRRMKSYGRIAICWMNGYSILFLLFLFLFFLFSFLNVLVLLDAHSHQPPSRHFQARAFVLSSRAFLRYICWGPLSLYWAPHWAPFLAEGVRPPRNICRVTSSSVFCMTRCNLALCLGRRPSRKVCLVSGRR